MEAQMVRPLKGRARFRIVGGNRTTARAVWLMLREHSIRPEYDNDTHAWFVARVRYREVRAALLAFDWVDGVTCWEYWQRTGLCSDPCQEARPETDCICICEGKYHGGHGHPIGYTGSGRVVMHEGSGRTVTRWTREALLALAAESDVSTRETG